MRLIVLTDNLRGGISYAHHAISSRAQLPILLNFLLEARDGNFFISSTDLEIGIRLKVPAKIEEEGEITVPAKTIMDLLGNIEQEKVELEMKGNVLELKGKGIKTSFPTLPATEFPKLYEAKGQKVAAFKKEEFDKEVSRVVFAASQDSGRPALSGVYIKSDNGGLTLVATDGYRLSLRTGFAPTSEKKEVKLLIPARVIKELVGQKEGEGEIALYVSEESNQVLFEYGSTELIGRLIEFEYPDYEKIIPTESTTKAVFDRVHALSAVRACSVFAREAANIIKMSIQKEKIVFSAQAAGAGENEVELEARVEGEENEIAFNARYLLEFFSNIDSEDIMFEMTGPLNSGIFKVNKEKSFLHLVMPIKIQG